MIDKPSDRMIVKPAVPGSVVRDPRTRRKLPDEGAPVPPSSYWHRRLRAGDVVLVEPETAPKSTPKPKTRAPATPMPAADKE